jgi:hypothetical protein
VGVTQALVDFERTLKLHMFEKMIELQPEARAMTTVIAIDVLLVR